MFFVGILLRKWFPKSVNNANLGNRLCSRFFFKNWFSKTRVRKIKVYYGFVRVLLSVCKPPRLLKVYAWEFRSERTKKIKINSDFNHKHFMHTVYTPSDSNLIKRLTTRALSQRKSFKLLIHFEAKNKFPYLFTWYETYPCSSMLHHFLLNVSYILCKTKVVCVRMLGYAHQFSA